MRVNPGLSDGIPLGFPAAHIVPVCLRDEASNRNQFVWRVGFRLTTEAQVVSQPIPAEFRRDVVKSPMHMARISNANHDIPPTRTGLNHSA